MQKLTVKKGLLLSVLLVAGCCEEIEPEYIVAYQNTCREVYHSDHAYVKKHPHTKPAVVNNTPHVKKRLLPNHYKEHVNDIGLVGSHGEML